MSVEGTDGGAASGDLRKLVHWMIMLWIGGLGFGGHLTLLRTRDDEDAIGPILSAGLLIVAVIWSVLSALTLFRRAREASAHPDGEDAAVDYPDMV